MKYLWFGTFITHFVFSQSVFENVGTKPGIEIWEIQESNIQKIETESYNFQNNINYGYIFLQTTQNSEEGTEFSYVYTIRYLIAKYLRIVIKYKVVDCVTHLWDAIKPMTLNEIYINRNDYNEETDRRYNFMKHFSDLSHYQSFPRLRLYKITINENKTLIIQVLPKFSELTQTDVFVFDSVSVIYIFCRRYRTKRVKKTRALAQKLANFINSNQYGGTKAILFNFENKNRPKAAPQEHLKFLEGYPVEFDTQSDLIYESLPDTIITDTRENIKRYTYPDITDKYEEISYLLTRMFKFNEKSYIIINERLMYVYVHIRPNPDFEELNTILKRGELLASYGYRIATVQKYNLLPDFVLTFEDLMECFIKNDDVFHIVQNIYNKLQ